MSVCAHTCYEYSIRRHQCCGLQVSGLAARLKQAEKDAALYNSREALFGRPTTDYTEVKKLSETFEPYQQFWSIAASWKVTHWSHLKSRALFSTRGIQAAKVISQKLTAFLNSAGPNWIPKRPQTQIAAYAYGRDSS